jgi:hypothetical protein
VTSRSCAIPAQIRRNQRVNDIRSKSTQCRIAQIHAVSVSEFVRKILAIISAQAMRPAFVRQLPDYGVV